MRLIIKWMLSIMAKLWAWGKEIFLDKVFIQQIIKIVVTYFIVTSLSDSGVANYIIGIIGIL